MQVSLSWYEDVSEIPLLSDQDPPSNLGPRSKSRLQDPPFSLSILHMIP